VRSPEPPGLPGRRSTGSKVIPVGRKLLRRSGASRSTGRPTMCISLCDPVATRLEFLNGAPLRDEFRGRLTDTYSVREPVMSNADFQSCEMIAATGTRREVLAANDVRILIANNLRSLICRCPATQQPVDLQVFADYVTLTRIRSNSVRFRCSHCGAQHETQVAEARPVTIWVKPQQANRARHQHATRGQNARSVSNMLVGA
jgi:hypothetical protein